MRRLLKYYFLGVAVVLSNTTVFGQNIQPYTASFIGRMGVDTVLVETYTMVNNHLYGKAFVRVPEDYIGEFSIHFYPDGSIREFNINAMNPFNSALPFDAKSGAFEYRLNMNCANDTCTYFNSVKDRATETIFKHPATSMDFVGGWVPLISLMEWNSIRLVKSGKPSLPLKMINHNIGVYDIGINILNKDTLIFGGPFLEYTKLMVDEAGRISKTDGIGTPWNYYVTKHPPINIDEVSKRMAKTKGIGIPSVTETLNTTIHGNNISVSYGRPLKRGRKIFGGVVPYDSLWRTGANGPTVISFDKDIKIGNTKISKGQYSIYTVPKQKEWTLIFNTDLTTWPTDPNRNKDFAEVVIPVKKGEKVQQQFTIEVEESRLGGIIKFSWDDITAFAAFEFLKN